MKTPAYPEEELKDLENRRTPLRREMPYAPVRMVAPSEEMEFTTGETPRTVNNTGAAAWFRGDLQSLWNEFLAARRV